jgi:hypothetical protein
MIDMCCVDVGVDGSRKISVTAHARPEIMHQKPSVRGNIVNRVLPCRGASAQLFVMIYTGSLSPI